MRAAVTIAAGALLVASGANREDAGWQAFSEVASVLTHPRCLNCHIPGDAPLQGDEGRPHNMNVRRAADGRGTPVARCTNCHQAANPFARNAPPGAPDWRLPPPQTKMAWKGLNTAEICRSLKDPTRNGGRSLAQLVEHLTSDRTVNWAWNPGSGRKPPLLSHEDFVRQFVLWTESGAPCGPKEER